MISTHFRIENPWINAKFNNIFHKDWLPFKHTVFEIEITQSTSTLAEIKFNLTFKRDHAGMVFAIGLFTYSVCFNLYDTRHWNNDANSWEVYDEQAFKKEDMKITQHMINEMVERFNKIKSNDNT